VPSKPATVSDGADSAACGVCLSGYEAIRPRPAGLGARDDVLIGFNDIPTLVGEVLDFAKLKVDILIGCADADVDDGLRTLCSLLAPVVLSVFCSISAPLTVTLEQAIETRGVSIALS
jgi:hypothetical protein